MILEQCPAEYAGPEVWHMIDLAEFAKRGNLPLPGGTLDQTQCFLDAARFVWTEESAHRARVHAAAGVPYLET